MKKISGAQIWTIVIPCVLFFGVTACENSKTEVQTTKLDKQQVYQDSTQADELVVDNIHPRKVELFNDVSRVRNLLSENGIGQLRSWRNDELGWTSSTEYYSFGATSNKNGQKNNLAYYLESDNSEYVKEVKLILNVNNPSEENKAKTKFQEMITKTFKILKLKKPDGILAAINKSKDFQFENDLYKASIKINKSNIDTWGFIIEAK